MRAVVQRVTSASVTCISKGLMVLVGVGSEDTPADIDILSNKMWVDRLCPFGCFQTPMEPCGRRAFKDISGEVLCVSQFTLMANTSKGNKPDFHRAMSSESSRQLYSAFLSKMRQLYVTDRILDGQFGAMMDVTLTNEGPVTFTLDTRKSEYVTPTIDNSDGKVEKSSKPGNSTLTPIGPDIAPNP
ncbi:D-Tyr tRNAtyr deacylase-like domain-containing protein [Pisolithus marmoratus]|nr:D-Tyr tRNAtyr deacylase-like domain-containing protein [Pisolithus marmoratus]